MGRPESKTEMYLVDRCEQEGIFCRKAEWINRGGCPDRYLARGPVQAWVECKSEIGELSVIQVTEIGRMRMAGLIVFVVSNRAEVDVVMRWFDNRYTEIPTRLIAFAPTIRSFDA